MDRYPGDRSFRRSQRLTAAAEFQRVFRDGRRSADDCFTVLFCHNKRDQPRLGLAIAKRRVRRAVARNRLKRLVRESFRAAAPSLPPMDIVVLAGPAAGNADNAKIFASLEQHWQRLAGRREQQERRGKH